MTPKATMVARISDNEDEKALLAQNELHALCEEEEDNLAVRRQQSRKSRYPLTITITIFNVLLLACTAWLLYLTTSKAACNALITDQDHYRATSAYSPVLDRFEFEKITTTVRGSLYESDPPSLLRDTGTAGDNKWFSIGTGVFPIVVSSEEVLKLGKDPALAVKIPEEHGYGSDAYLAQNDVFHHLHCVDMLRKEAYSPWNYRSEADKKSSDSQHWAHISHCLDILAQTLMCSSSADVILFNWVNSTVFTHPFPDFKTKKVCRNFDAYLDWVNANSIRHEVFEAMTTPPEDYPVLPDPASVVTG